MLIIPFCPFFFFSNKIFVKDFSGTTAHRILKFCTNIRYELLYILYCVRENQHPYAYHSLYLSFFSFSPIKVFVTDFSVPMRASLQTLYTPTEG